MDAQHTRSGLALVGVGALPFAVAPALHAAPALDLACPFLAVTGLPCPFCGATRAVALAARGDAAFLDYGAVWVVVLALVALAGLATVAGRRPALRHPVTALVATLAVAWAWALAHTATIAA